MLRFRDSKCWNYYNITTFFFLNLWLHHYLRTWKMAFHVLSNTCNNRSLSSHPLKYKTHGGRNWERSAANSYTQNSRREWAKLSVTVYKKVLNEWYFTHYWVINRLHFEIATYNDTVLLVGLQADRSDVTNISAAQWTEEASLTVLMASKQLPVCHNQATWDARGGRHTLRDNL